MKRLLIGGVFALCLVSCYRGEESEQLRTQLNEEEIQVSKTEEVNKIAEQKRQENLYNKQLLITNITSEYDDYKNEVMKIEISNNTQKVISSIEIMWIKGNAPDVPGLDYMADRKSWERRKIFSKINLNPNYKTVLNIPLSPESAKDIRISWIKYSDGSFENL